MASWLLAFLVPFIVTAIPGWNPQGGWPELPYLLSPYGTAGHVRSSVYYLIVILAAGFVTAAIMEWPKFLLGGRNTSSAPYLALLIHQLVTFTDVIRANAYDWWTYLLHIVNLYEIDRWSWRHLHPSLIGRWPWPTALSAMVAGSIIIVRYRKNRSERTTIATDT